MSTSTEQCLHFIVFYIKVPIFVAVTQNGQNMKRVIVETCDNLFSLLIFQMMHIHQKYRINILRVFKKFNIDVLKKLRCSNRVHLV